MSINRTTRNGNETENMRQKPKWTEKKKYKTHTQKWKGEVKQAEKQKLGLRSLIEIIIHWNSGTLRTRRRSLKNRSRNENAHKHFVCSSRKFVFKTKN